MLDIITSLFLVIAYSIMYIFSSGENKQKAKENLKETISGSDGQILLGAFGAVAIIGFLFVIFYL